MENKQELPTEFPDKLHAISMRTISNYMNRTINKLRPQHMDKKQLKSTLIQQITKNTWFYKRRIRKIISLCIRNTLSVVSILIFLILNHPFEWSFFEVDCVFSHFQSVLATFPIKNYFLNRTKKKLNWNILEALIVSKYIPQG